MKIFLNSQLNILGVILSCLPRTHNISAARLFFDNLYLLTKTCSHSFIYLLIQRPQVCYWKLKVWSPAEIPLLRIDMPWDSYLYFQYDFSNLKQLLLAPIPNKVMVSPVNGECFRCCCFLMQLWDGSHLFDLEGQNSFCLK